MPHLTGVRARRRKTGVKSGRFAVLTGYSRAALISIENGTRPASVEGAERIAAVLTDLGVPTKAADLMTVPDEPPRQPGREPTHPKRRQDAEEERKGPPRETSQVAV